MTASFRGNVGKEEHCQVGLYAAYASRHGYGFLDNRLFIPEKWFDLHLERRQIHPLENFVWLSGVCWAIELVL